MGDYEPRSLELTNSQKAERFFAGLNNYITSTVEDQSRSNPMQSTNQFGNSQVLGSTALVHMNGMADQTIQSEMQTEDNSGEKPTRSGSKRGEQTPPTPRSNEISAYSDLNKPIRDDNCERRGISRFYSNNIYDLNEPVDEEKVTGDFESRLENNPQHLQSYVDTYDCQPREDLYTETEFQSVLSSARIEEDKQHSH